jgi:hypothetical protein
MEVTHPERSVVQREQRRARHLLGSQREWPGVIEARSALHCKRLAGEHLTCRIYGG